MSTSTQDLVAQAKQEIEEIDVKTTQRRLAEGAVVIDVREAEELERGCIPQAVHIPRGLLEFRAPEHAATADRDTPLVVYCGAGGRAALAAQSLQKLGYTRVASLAGGFGAWVEAGQEVRLPAAQGDDEE